jgi:hypothetical protein
VIRGNSGSGKTTTAHEVRRRYGRGCALVEQDYLRRIVLREHDRAEIGPVAPGFIADDMLGWYAPNDLLGVPGEGVLTAPGVEDAVSTILHTSGLASAAALTPCPARCPRCDEKLS